MKGCRDMREITRSDGQVLIWSIMCMKAMSICCWLKEVLEALQKTVQILISVLIIVVWNKLNEAEGPLQSDTEWFYCFSSTSELVWPEQFNLIEKGFIDFVWVSTPQLISCMIFGNNLILMQLIKSCPPQTQVQQNFKMLSYLEMGSLQMLLN